MDNEFTKVKRKGRVSRNELSCNKNADNLCKFNQDIVSSVENQNIRPILKRVEENRLDLRDSDFYSTFADSLQRCLHDWQNQNTVGGMSTSNTDTGVESSQLTSNPKCKDKSTKSVKPNTTQIHDVCRDLQSVKLCDCDVQNYCENCDCNKDNGKPRIQNLVCYGLGKLTSCITARYQLALILCVIRLLKIAPCQCQFYDPCFSEGDILVLKHFGFSVMEHNEEGKHAVDDTPCIFFMPHCGKALFNNLIWANWCVDGLSRMVVIGNSFQQMIDSLLTRQVRRNLQFVDRIMPYTIEVPILNTFRYSDIFNDLSIHYFPRPKLCEMPLEFWTDATEPIYDTSDLEIIPNTS